ncbi:MAG: tetratricopeptide repeat protein [Gammaproteobacteria bacterium]|nr:tetratricopeptide repeat protein [Gammaproteobacteria bacterium]
MRSALRLLLPGVLLLLTAACNQLNLRSADASDLKQIVALRNEAQAAYGREDWPAAEKAYRRLVELVPAEADNWFRLGNVYVHLDRHYDAIGLYKEALVRDPGHVRAWHNLGITQLRQATNTFVEMQKYTGSADPVAERARRIVEAVTRVLEVPDPGEATAE